MVWRGFGGVDGWMDGTENTENSTKQMTNGRQKSMNGTGKIGVENVLMVHGPAHRTRAADAVRNSCNRVCHAKEFLMEDCVEVDAMSCQ